MEDHTSDATLLMDLPGLVVWRVERLADGSRVAWLATADETARACPGCGVFADRVKGVVCTRPRDLPCGPGEVSLVWVKRRWYCRELNRIGWLLALSPVMSLVWVAAVVTTMSGSGVDQAADLTQGRWTRSGSGGRCNGCCTPWW